VSVSAVCLFDPLTALSHQNEWTCELWRLGWSGVMPESRGDRGTVEQFDFLTRGKNWRSLGPVCSFLNYFAFLRSLAVQL